MRPSLRYYLVGVLVAVLFFWHRVFATRSFLPWGGGAGPAEQPECPLTRGRGLAHYAALSKGFTKPASAPPSPPACLQNSSPASLSHVKHCCLVHHLQEGRTGNQLVNYFAGRLYAELHSCASSAVSFGDGLGREGGVALSPEGTLWPPAGGEAAWQQRSGSSGVPLDATRSLTGLRALFESGSAPSIVLKAQLERADSLYVAASLAWDLQGASLVGLGLPALAPAVLRDEATEARCRRWGEEREACWRDPGGKALHPWMPEGLRDLAVKALNWAARTSALAAAGAGAAAEEGEEEEEGVEEGGGGVSGGKAAPPMLCGGWGAQQLQQLLLRLQR